MKVLIISDFAAPYRKAVFKGLALDGDGRKKVRVVWIHSSRLQTKYRSNNRIEPERNPVKKWKSVVL